MSKKGMRQWSVFVSRNARDCWVCQQRIAPGVWHLYVTICAEESLNRFASMYLCKACAFTQYGVKIGENHVDRR